MLLLRPLIRYADFRGRASRGEYWLFMLSQGLIYVGCIVLAVTSLANGPRGVLGLAGWLGFALLLMLAFALPNYAVLARRLHDSGRSAFWIALLLPTFATNLATFRAMGTVATQSQLTGLGSQDAIAQALAGPFASVGAIAIAIVASICSMALFVLTLMPGTQGPNRFGPDPRDPDAKAPMRSAGIDDDRLEELFAQARRESRGGEVPYKPVFDFGPGPIAETPAPPPRTVDWGQPASPAWDPRVAPSRPFGRRT